MPNSDISFFPITVDGVADSADFEKSDILRLGVSQARLPVCQTFSLVIQKPRTDFLQNIIGLLSTFNFQLKTLDL